MTKIILASKNKNKAREINDILGSDFEVVTQEDIIGSDFEVIEDGKTFKENAIKKAEEISKMTGFLTLADDSGLCVDYLNGAPGVYSARFAGENATDDENVDKLLNSLKDVPFGKRGGRFVCVIALASPDTETLTFKGECSGSITFERKGQNGFGYDPVFYVTKYDKTMAELEPHLKNAISHRSKALKKLVYYFQNK